MKITILGAGLIGVATAYYLWRDGHDVEVIEREAEPASVTSYANACLISASRALPWPNPGSRGALWRSLTDADAPMRVTRWLDPALWRWLRERIGAGPIQVPPEARVRVHRFKAGAARLVAFERNIDYQMSEELKQAGGNEALEQPIDLTAQLTAGGGEAGAPFVYDLRAGRLVGRVDHWSFRLDPWEPSLFALLPEPLPAETLVATLLQRLGP